MTTEGSAEAKPRAKAPRDPGSLRANLLRWLVGSLVALLIANTVAVYLNAVDAANDAYDRTLLVSARMVAENLNVVDGRLSLTIPYAAMDMLESDIKGRLYFRVTAPGGATVAGWDDLPPAREDVPLSPLYAALVRFYDDEYHGARVRVATLVQPVVGAGFNGIVTVQFVEDYQSRHGLIRSILAEAVVSQGLLIVVAVLLVLWTIHVALRPFHRLSTDLAARTSEDLSPFERSLVHREVRPLLDALNSYVARLRNLIEVRKRFIGNAAHQLRTPLAVLKTQSGFAARTDDRQELRDVVAAMGATVDEAARIANQLLTLARAEHGFAVEGARSVDLLALARETVLEWFDRARDRGIDLGFEGPEVVSDMAQTLAVRGDAMLLHELLVNLIDNAVRYCARGDAITVRVVAEADARVRLEVDDSGPSIPVSERGKVFERFYRMPGGQSPGSGLGLSIVREIAQQHRASVRLDDSPLGGLRVVAEFPRAPSPGVVPVRHSVVDAKVGVR